MLYIDPVNTDKTNKRISSIDLPSINIRILFSCINIYLSTKCNFNEKDLFACTQLSRFADQLLPRKNYNRYNLEKTSQAYPNQDQQPGAHQTGPKT